MKILQKFLGPIIYALSVLFILIMYFQLGSDNVDQGVGTGLYTAYILVILGIVGIAFGFVMTAVTNPQSIIRTTIGVGVIVVIWFISYGMAGNEVLELYKKFEVDASLSKMIGGILILTYSLLILCFVGIILSEVRSALRI